MPTKYVEYKERYSMGVDDLTKYDRQFLLALNGRLAEIEDQIKAEAIDTAGALKARVEASSDWIQDYEIECTISFWLREDDPAYKEYDDNILIELREYLKGIDDDRLGIADCRNHKMASPSGFLAIRPGIKSPRPLSRIN